MGDALEPIRAFLLNTYCTRNLGLANGNLGLKKQLVFYSARGGSADRSSNRRSAKIRGIRDNNILENPTYYETSELNSSAPPAGTTGLGSYTDHEAGTVYHDSSNGISESATANPRGNAVSATTTISPPLQLNPRAPYWDYGSGGTAFAALSYEVEIVGRDGWVPVTIFAAGEASALPDDPGYASASASAAMEFSGPGVSISADACVNEASLSCTYSYFTINGVYQMFANTSYLVAMFAEAEGSVYARGPTTLAGADVDPEFIAPPGYSVVLSPGVGNPTLGVPEPSTWSMMLIGVAGLGYAGYRARRRATDTANA